jgi:hypothetical protein
MSALDDEPISYREQTPGDTPGMVFVVFDGQPEGIWTKQQWRFEVDEQTAALIRQYCENRAAQGQPIYKNQIERDFGVTACN